MDLSIIVPAKNEKENIEPLVVEIVNALQHTNFEIIYVDDGSDDGTFEEIVRLQQSAYPMLKVIQHQYSVGQSGAIYTAVKAAQGTLVITLDADGQNDPADIPAMLEKARHQPDNSHFCIAGYRKNRKDTAWKRFQSRVANRIRSKILNDGTPDTGCGLKILPRATFLCLPYFDHMHRFIPALVTRLQGNVEVVVINHRDRQAGVSKYNMWGRLKVGVVDMFGVMWLQKRYKKPVIAKQQ
ncbi:glycosyltransferase family 2 protein [Neptunicella marina]|uniref:Glycosyltransferase family 2 protein n=1 Tax=Neptunicella marina TaxID=2125989 RepID=A0A8J6IWM0_9ALTE|nr:glycosyltransferase family 2 protein [Neptunicella marina]MBC3766950.1 glycosyltransferase family 2 protein [Neptunicella marina]